MEADQPTAIPPPMPLYTFPRASDASEGPPMTGFSHSLPVLRHRTQPARRRRGTALRERSTLMERHARTMERARTEDEGLHHLAPKAFALDSILLA